MSNNIVNRLYMLTILSIILVGLTLSSVEGAPVLSYKGAVNVGRPLGRIVADPFRPKVYGITGTGDIVFIDRTTMSVEKVVSTGRTLRDIDVDPLGNRLLVLDNVTGQYRNQPAAVYIEEYDLDTQALASTSFVKAPLYQMALGRPGRILGVGLNQWVDAYQVNRETGNVLSSCSAGFYGKAEWKTPTFASTNDGQRLFRTELGISSIELIAFDTSTDTIHEIDSRYVGSHSPEPIFLNSTNSSLYVGGLRVNPDNINELLGTFPEDIYAATGNDLFAFGTDFIYDPSSGIKLGEMPIGSTMMTIGDYDQYLYAFDKDTMELQVMQVVPEPASLFLFAVGGLLALRLKQSSGNRDGKQRLPFITS